MKDLNHPLKFVVYSVTCAIFHPQTKISYYYCSSCKIRFPASASECPKCHDKVESSPDSKEESPIPWWGSVIVLGIGVGVCVTGACLKLPALDRVGDALIFIPLGNLFGMSQKRG